MLHKTCMFHLWPLTNIPSINASERQQKWCHTMGSEPF